MTTYYNLFFDRCTQINELHRYRQCRFPGQSVVGIEVNEDDVRFACRLLEFEFNTLMQYIKSVAEEVLQPVEPMILLDDDFDLLNMLFECVAAVAYRKEGEHDDQK